MRTNFKHLEKQFSTKNIKIIQTPNTEMMPITAEDIMKSENTDYVPLYYKNTIRTSIGYITI